MKVLITYASRHGATAGIAARVAARLSRNGIEADLQPVDEVCDVSAYDAVVIGGAAYMSHWLKEAVRFAERHREDLAKRPVWIFSSGPLGTEVVDKQGNDILESSRPREFDTLADLLDPRDEHVFFGAYDPTAAPIGITERMVRHLPAVSEALPRGDFREWTAIDAWADQIAAELARAGRPSGKHSGGDHA